MESERRRSKIINIDVTIQVKSVNQNSSVDQPTAVDVNVVDISTTGMAFKSDYQFKLGTYYDANITLENKESIQTIIEVIRAECIDDSIQYGCCFVGITPEQQFKISVYQIVAENANAPT